LPILFTACTPIEVAVTETPAQSPEIDIDEIDSDGLTVILFKSPIFENDMAMASYASGLLAAEGWDVEFKIVDRPNLKGDYTPEEYQSLIMSELNSGKDVVFEYNGFLDIDEFKANRYLARTDRGGYNYLKSMGQRREYSYQGIFINKDLEELYGEEINSIEDYDRFLEWTGTYAPSNTACLMVMQSPLGDYLNPVSLFAQMSGYAKVDHVVSGFKDGASTIFFSYNDMINYKRNTPTVYEAVELPFFMEMDTYLNKWTSNSLLEIISYDEFSSTTGYSSIVCNVRDSTNYYSKDYTKNSLQLLDLSDFNLHILTYDKTSSLSPYIYECRRSSLFGFASDDPSKSLAEAFLDWIYSSSDNYHLFMFGIEGADYKVVDGQLEFLTNTNGIKYGEWPKHASFIDDTMHPVMPHFPSNWATVQQDFSQTEGFYISGFNVAVTKEGEKYSTNDELLSILPLSSLDSGVYGLYERYFMDIGKDADRYTPWKLGVDIEESPDAQNRKTIYTEILNFCREIN
jgi:hypothetical protein